MNTNYTMVYFAAWLTAGTAAFIVVMGYALTLVTAAI